MYPFLFRYFPDIFHSGDVPFHPEFPGASPPYDLCSPDDEEFNNPRIPQGDLTDEKDDIPPLVTAWSPPLPPMRMLQSAYMDIMGHLSEVVPEAGGMLLGPKGTSVVTHYFIDEKGKATAASFTLDAVGLNRMLKKALACNLDCKGLVHSHPPGCTRPSGGDLAYVRKSFANEKNSGLTEFLLPIFCDGILIPYLIRPREPEIVQMAQLILF